MKRWGLLLCVGALTLPSLAREYFSLFPTPRGLAMGGAMTATATGFDALSYNPAGLALNAESQFMAPEIVSLTGSPSIRDIIDTLSSLDNSQPIAKQMKTFDGKAASFAVSLLGFRWAKKRFAVSAENYTQASLRIRTPSLLFAKVDARLTMDFGVSGGYAHEFYNGKLRFGVTLRPAVIRAGLNTQLESAEILNLQGANLIQDMGGLGWGVDADLGLQGHWNPVKILGFDVRPMWGMVAQNLFASTFPFRILKDNYRGDPPALERTYHFGIAGRAENLGVVKPTLAIDYRHIGLPAESFLERIAVGLEILFSPRPLFRTAFRGHFASGNFGGGLAFGFGPGEFEFGSYAVNLGARPGVGVDRRVYGRLALVW